MNPGEYLKMRYAAPPECCKCGDCQLVPPATLQEWETRMASMETGLKLIRDTFKLDLQQGYSTKDKQFAIDIADAALKTSKQT